MKAAITRDEAWRSTLLHVNEGSGQPSEKAEMQRQSLDGRPSPNQAPKTTANSYAIPQPKTVEETGLEFEFLADLALKTLYFSRQRLASDIAKSMALPFPVVKEVLDYLKAMELCGVTGSEGPNEQFFHYALTKAGFGRLEEVLKRDKYCGPAPVPFDRYREIVDLQSGGKLDVDRESVALALQKLVLDHSVIGQVAAATRSGASMFLFGPPGNGKTSIAEGIGRMLGGAVFIPYAVEVRGHVIRVFDPTVHRVAARQPDGTQVGGDAAPRAKQLDIKDQRWVRIETPFMMVGGELTIDQLDLIYDHNGGFYEAPVQMKANGGVLLIDDFGRQQVEPKALLNRWIVPLEKRVDYLGLHTGDKVEIPFNMILIFATNLRPADLVEEAFLRRIRYKIQINDPTPEQYREIFHRACLENGIDHDDEVVTYLLEQYYQRAGTPLRACQPRDILAHTIDFCDLDGCDLHLTRELIDRACEAYFVDDSGK